MPALRHLPATAPQMNPRPNGTPGAASFYVTGGTLRPDAPCYVERQADRELCEGLLQGEFCYVLTSRQMGKSSLMVRTVKRLRQDGVAVAVLDLTAIGQNLTIEQWYDGLVSRLGQQLNLEDPLLDFWNAHLQWSPLQRWLGSIEEVVLKKIAGRVVIFIDEIDIVRSLPFSTDEFFAAIREAYNRRTSDPAFAQTRLQPPGRSRPVRPHPRHPPDPIQHRTAHRTARLHPRRSRPPSARPRLRQPASHACPSPLLDRRTPVFDTTSLPLSGRNFRTGLNPNPLRRTAG